jgi:microcin C transport system permease protein
MLNYIVKRLLLMIPTLLGVMLLTFALTRFVPGGPVDLMMAKLDGQNTDATSRVSGSGSETGSGENSTNSTYRGGQGIDEEFRKQLIQQYGFDKPVHEQFFKLVKDYSTFNFGTSYYRDQPVLSLILEKMPVSISLGIWILLASYLVSIPLGIKKAISDGSKFDVWTSTVVIIGYAIPSFIFAILLIILFAGGSYYNWFPLRGLTSDDFDKLDFFGKIKDYAWHLALPLIATGISAFATTTLLTKNSFIDEIRKQYVTTARAKGLTERSVLYGHVFRNAMLLVISGFPAAFLSAFVSSSLLIETVFSLDGLGYLTFTSTVNRDYPVVLATIFIFTLLSLIVTLISDLTYTWIDPRIDFESREV